MIVGSSDSDGLGLVVESLPTGTAVATTRYALVAPDPTVVVKLIETVEGDGDGHGLGIVVEPLPTGAGIAVARRAGITPDRGTVARHEQRGRKNAHAAGRRQSGRRRRRGPRGDHIVAGAGDAVVIAVLRT